MSVELFATDTDGIVTGLSYHCLVNLHSSRDQSDLYGRRGAVRGTELDDDLIVRVGVVPGEGNVVYIGGTNEIFRGDRIGYFTTGTSACGAPTVSESLDFVDIPARVDDVGG